MKLAWLCYTKCFYDGDELATQPETEIKITDQQLREICQQVRDERLK